MENSTISNNKRDTAVTAGRIHRFKPIREDGSGKVEAKWTSYEWFADQPANIGEDWVRLNGLSDRMQANDTVRREVERLSKIVES